MVMATPCKLAATDRAITRATKAAVLSMRIIVTGVAWYTFDQLGVVVGADGRLQVVDGLVNGRKKS